MSPASDTGPGAEPRHDGFYVRPASEDSTSFLRFFPEGKVVACTIGDQRPPEEYALNVARWMVPGNSSPQQGSYRLEGGELAFSAVSDSGTVDYWGVVEDDRLSMLLHVHSLINGHREHGVWRFLPLPDDPPTPGGS
ncbi:hypothetical protein [Actinomadura hibisca]|uniref:hypothetical protein n=1 Tax=Actinomadura hibisca TaxID=68565 RepID=UPI00082E0393|nr:hypothetical protein [Actinomadura hibisca]